MENYFFKWKDKIFQNWTKLKVYRVQFVNEYATKVLMQGKLIAVAYTLRT